MKPLPSFLEDFVFRGATLLNSGRSLFLWLKSRFLVVDVVQAHFNSSLHFQVICSCATGGNKQFLVVRFRCWNWAEGLSYMRNSLPSFPASAKILNWHTSQRRPYLFCLFVCI